MVFATYDVTMYKGERTVNEEDDEEDDEPQDSGLCCLSGCLTGVASAILFIIILPAGILLSFYAVNRQDYGVLSAGIFLIAVPIICLPVFIIVFYNRRRLRRIKRQFRKTKVIDSRTTKY